MLVAIHAIWLAALLASVKTMTEALGVAERGSRDVVVIGLLTTTVSPWWRSGQYFGIEYEDAYEYQAAGALLSAGGNWTSGLNPVCLAGTLADCQALGTLAHPVGLAALLSLFYLKLRVRIDRLSS